MLKFKASRYYILYVDQHNPAYILDECEGYYRCLNRLDTYHDSVIRDKIIIFNTDTEKIYVPVYGMPSTVGMLSTVGLPCLPSMKFLVALGEYQIQ